MALVIRLRKLGTKGQPFFRIAVTESATARDGRFVEEIGWYDPKKSGNNSSVDEERARYWMSKGAKPSDTVRSVFKRHGLIGPGKTAKTAVKVAAAVEQAVEPAPEPTAAETGEQPE
ncbi:MAG: 30S ribosomal protein S16 [Verrucomicrobia bacterium]|nr:30S ribosomal protein S16 [Verrucomicrobiota bacterium]